MTAVTSSVGTGRRRSIARHLVELRAALEEQRLFRAEQLTELAAHAAGGPTLTLDDPRDEVTGALRAAAMDALFEIEAAIARMEAGTYGVCETCNEPIPLARLEILPMAALCMRCAHAREQRLK